jgi:hypothetical protein
VRGQPPFGEANLRVDAGPRANLASVGFLDPVTFHVVAVQVPRTAATVACILVGFAEVDAFLARIRQDRHNRDAEQETKGQEPSHH